MLAVCGELECMDILVSAGADPSTPDIHGAYPIHYAAQMCGPNSEMGNDVRVGLAALRRLIQLGVDVSVRDQDGRPPLLWAASVGKPNAKPHAETAECSDEVRRCILRGLTRRCKPSLPEAVGAACAPSRTSVCLCFVVHAN